MYTAITLSRRIGVLMMETALQNMTWCSDQWCTEFGFVANDRCWDSAYSITTLNMIAKVVHIADGRQIFLWRCRSHQQRYRWYNDGTTWCKLTWNVCVVAAKLKIFHVERSLRLPAISRHEYTMYSSPFRSSLSDNVLSKPSNHQEPSKPAKIYT